MQTSMSLRDSVRTPRKRATATKRIAIVDKDEQNKQLSLHLIPWMIEKHPLELMAMMAQPEIKP